MVARSSTAEQVATDLRRLILSGELAPNTPLKEAEISAAFGTSRNTVRETLLLLTHEGLVQRTRHRGAVVSTFEAADIREMCQARKVLELAAVDAIETDPSIDLSPLTAALDTLIDAVGRDDWDDIPLADAMFHRALVSLRGNKRLIGMYDQLLSEIRLATLISTQIDASEGQSVVDEHRRVHDLLAQRGFDDCRAELTRMFDETEQRLLHTYSDEG